MSADPPGGPATYRFGPRDRRGLIIGLRNTQVLILALSLVSALGALRTLGGALGVLFGTVLLVAGAATAFWPLAGRTVEEWLPVAARFALAALAGRRREAPTRSGPNVEPGIPRPFSDLEVVALDVDSRVFGAVHDRRRGTWTGVLSVIGGGFALLGAHDRERSIAVWSGVLASIARESGALHRLQWIDRTTPDRGELLDWGSGDAAAKGPPADYAAFLAEQARDFVCHETFLACSVRDATGPEGLEAELAAVSRRCAEAGVSVGGPLSAAGVRALVRQGLEVTPSRRIVRRPWPVAVRTSWAEVAVDGLSHVTYWIAEWPRSDVRDDFLLPLLLGAGAGARRTVSVTMEPLRPGTALRAAEHARTARVADAELRRRHGFAVTARSRREQDAVERREQELAAGHVGYRFSGYVTVSAPTGPELVAACARVEQAAALARLDLRRLYGSQAEALLFCLPAGRGCG